MLGIAMLGIGPRLNQIGIIRQSWGKKHGLQNQ